MRADELLSGPRGRRMCWELLGLTSFGLADLPMARVMEAVAGEAEALSTNGPENERPLFEALRASADAAMYWQEPDECDVYLAGSKLREPLLPVAELVVASSSTGWWSTSCALDAQRYVRFLESGEGVEEPRLTGAADVLREERADEERRNADMRKIRTGRTPEVPAADWNITTGKWWSAPIGFGVPSTSREHQAFGPVGLWLVEDFPGFERAAVWPVRGTGQARIFEIAGSQDWADLATRYPLDVTDGRGPDWARAASRRGRWLIPDWHAVSQHFDAVHLTVAGYLSTAGRAVPVESDAATFLAGWAPDETYWLTDRLRLDGPATMWKGDRYDGWEPDLL